MLALVSYTTFDWIQIALEILYLNIVGYYVFKYIKLTIVEIILIFLILVLFLVVELIDNNIIYLIHLKNFIIGVLSVIYFSRKYYYFSEKIFTTFTLILVSVSIVQYINYDLIPTYLISKDFNGPVELIGKPLGIFSNYHFNAFVLAILFIFLVNNLTKFWLANVFMFKFGSNTSWYSYNLQLIFNYLKLYRYNMKFIMPLMAVIFFSFAEVAYQFIMRVDVDKYTSSMFSMEIILSEIHYLINYIDYTNLLPSAKDQSVFSYLNINNNHDGMSEIMYLHIIQEGGLLIGTLYIFYILSQLRKTRIMMILSLFHYAYIYSPLVWFLIFSIELKKNENKK